MSNREEKRRSFQSRVSKAVKLPFCVKKKAVESLREELFMETNAKRRRLQAAKP